MTQKQVSTRRLGQILKKLKITDNTIILVRHGSLTKEQMDELFRITNEAVSAKGIVYCVVENIDDIRALPEIEMNRHGWYRFEHLAKIIKKSQEKQNDSNTKPVPIEPQ